MAVTHPTDVRNGIADYVVDLIDAGGAGTIVFQDGNSSDSDVATLTFSATAFGAVCNEWLRAGLCGLPLPARLAGVSGQIPLKASEFRTTPFNVESAGTLPDLA